MAALKNGPIRIALAAESTAAPSGTAGTAVTFSGSWVEIAWDLDSGDISINKEFNVLKIQGPTDQAPLGRIVLQNYIREISFPGYEFIEATFSNAGSATAATGVVTESTSPTRQAVCIELRGIGLLWFPSCDVEWTSLKGAVDAQASIQYTITPYGTTSYAAGWNWQTFS